MLGRVVTVSTRMIRPIVEGLLAAGVSPETVLSRFGTSRAALDDPDGRVPHSLAINLWLAAVEATSDPDFGVHAAERLQPGALDVVDYAARASRTLREGIECFLRFSRLNHDAVVLRLEVDANAMRLSHRLPLGRVLPRPPADYLATAWLTLGRQMVGRPFDPLEVHFSHEQPGDPREYRRVFGSARLRFGAPELSMAFPASLADEPLVAADPGLVSVLLRHASDLLSKLPNHESFIDQVRSLLLNELHGGNPSLANIAGKLQLSESTLHRRLKDEGTSHKELLEALRAELAQRYLKENIGITEVAFLLGFSEPSAFHRAFKRWTGQTPAAFRGP